MVRIDRRGFAHRCAVAQRVPVTTAERDPRGRRTLGQQLVEYFSLAELGNGLHGKHIGTLNYSSHVRRQRPFDVQDLEIVQLDTFYPSDSPVISGIGDTEAVGRVDAGLRLPVKALAVDGGFSIYGF